VTAEKWVQYIIDIVRAKGCATRRYIISQLQSLGLTKKHAERVAEEHLANLVRRNVIVRKGRGLYCWAATA
jgi:hypothetical protein